MRLTPLGEHTAELELRDGTVILFSYSTPVAARLPGVGTVRTSVHHSRTTEKHLTQWGIATYSAVCKPQSYFDDLLKLA